TPGHASRPARQALSASVSSATRAQHTWWVARLLGCAYSMRMTASRRPTRTPRKVATNLSVRADLVRRARARKLNLSGVFEEAVEAALQRSEQEAWQRDNAASIDAYNEHVERRGLFADKWRKF